MTTYRGIPLSEIRKLPRPRLLWPNEHGAWGIFATSFLAGWLTAPKLSWGPLLLLPAALGAFLTRYPIGLWFKKRRVTRALSISLSREKRWFWIYGIPTAIVSVPLFYPLKWWWILPFAIISTASFALHIVAIVKKKERSLLVETTAMIGLSCLTPAASFASLGAPHWQPIVIWAVLVIFYLGRIVSVRRKVSRKREEPVDLRTLGKWELLYSLLFLILLVGMTRIISLFPHLFN